MYNLSSVKMCPAACVHPVHILYLTAHFTWDLFHNTVHILYAIQSLHSILAAYFSLVQLLNPNTGFQHPLPFIHYP